MFAADTNVKLRINRLTEFDSHFHKLAYAVLVEFSKRIVLENLCIIVRLEEFACVITRETECHLCKVVCTEAEEISLFCDFVSCKSRTRNFNHSTNFIFEIDARCFDFSVSSFNNRVFNEFKLFNFTYERNHNFGNNLPVGVGFLNFYSSADNRFCLHFSNFGVSYRKTASSVTHHRVSFVEAVDDVFDFAYCFTLCFCENFNISFLCGNKLVERRIEETDCYRVTFQSFVEFFKVALLHRKNFIKCSFSFFNSVSANHFSECVNSVALKEHMLGTAKTDTFSAEFNCVCSVSRCICVCSYFKSSVFVGPSHNSAEVTADRSFNCGNNTVVNVTCRTVDGDFVTLCKGLACENEFFVFFVHNDIGAARYTASTHTSCNNRCVRGHTASYSEDTLCGFHTFNIFRRGFKTYQNDFFAFFSPSFCVVSREYNFTASGTGRCGKRFAENVGFLKRNLVKLRMEERIEVSRVDHLNRVFICNHTLVNKVTSNFKSSGSRSFTISCLEHIKFFVLNCEFHILHIAVMVFKFCADVYKLVVNFGHNVFELVDRLRCSYTCNNVLALCVKKELTEEFLFTCSRVSCERNTGTRCIAHITECHHLNVNCSTPRIRNVVVTSVNVCTRVVPRTEYGFDSAHKLFLRIVREIFADFSFVFSFKLICKLFQIFSGKLNVLGYAFFLFHFVDELFKIFFADFHNNVGIHLNKSSVAVVSPSGIVRLFRHNFGNGFVKTEVKNGIHHTGHRRSCTASYRYEERIFGIAEFHSRDFFHFYDVLHNFSLDFIIDFLSVLVILCAGFRSNGKSLRNRHSESCHLCEVGTFAAQEISH